MSDNIGALIENQPAAGGEPQAADTRPTCLIVRTAGTNCDRELVHAFTLAGAQARTEHLNTLIQNPDLIDAADMIGFPGGFSYGDDIAAGRILANRLKHRLYPKLVDAVHRGVPMIGICNGFQVLAKLGLLPEPDAGRQTATLADNTSGRFLDRWVRVQAPAETVCIWTRGLGDFDLPVAHGEGRFVPESAEAMQRWAAAGQIALRYAADDNPNGSVEDVAGVCDASGLVLGLMPHPERWVHPTHHPAWSRRGEDAWTATPPGLRFFHNAVQHVLTRRAR